MPCRGVPFATGRVSAGGAIRGASTGADSGVATGLDGGADGGALPTVTDDVTGLPADSSGAEPKRVLP